MTQIGELVGVGIPLNDLDWECPHKHDQDEYDEAENDVDNNEQDDEAEAEGAAEGHDVRNSSGRLGRALKAAEKPRVDTSTDPEKRVAVPGYAPHGSSDTEFAYTVAAHHLIPGNAALKISKIMDYVAKSKGKIVENIGYNVNGRDNGIWLVGWYAVRRGKNNPNSGKSWGEMGEDPFREEYVKAAIATTGAQFHDTHPKYSENVLKRLDLLALKLEKTNTSLCEDCKKVKENNGKLPPPYWVKDRLAAFSAFLAGKLRGATKASWNLALWCTSKTWKSTMDKM